WNKVASQITSHKKSSHRQFYKVAAAILIFASLGYVAYVNRTDPKVLETQISEISAGTDKAILTLADGSQVVLAKGTSYKNKSVLSNGERLEYAQANKDSKIAYNILTIPRGGQYQVILSDSTVVWLNADTKIKYPVNFVEGEPRNRELVYGEAYFKVSPSTKHQGSAFTVLANGQDVVVLGTSFNIKAYHDESLIAT